MLYLCNPLLPQLIFLKTLTDQNSKYMPDKKIIKED